MVMTLMSNPKGSVATIIVATDGSGDTTDIQTGINLLPATGGVVYIKEGTYTITAIITFPNDNISLIGAGKSTIVYATFNFALIYIAQDYISIESISVMGNSTGVNQTGIWIYNSDEGTIRNCRLEDLGGEGIEISNLSDGNHISNNKIINIERNGILLSSTGAGATVKENIIISNFVYDTKRDGIRLEAGNDGECENNIVSNNIIINADRDDSTTYSGITLEILFLGDLPADNVIIGNNIRDCDNYGIDIKNGSKNIVVGNLCLNNTTGGINDSGTDTELGHNITT